MSGGKITFVGTGAAGLKLANLNRDVVSLHNGSGPLALRKAIIHLDQGGHVVATPKWAIGWRAPMGTEVVLDESCDELEEAVKLQMKARVLEFRT